MLPIVVVSCGFGGAIRRAGRLRKDAGRRVSARRGLEEIEATNE